MVSYSLLLIFFFKYLWVSCDDTGCSSSYSYFCKGPRVIIFWIAPYYIWSSSRKWKSSDPGAYSVKRCSCDYYHHQRSFMFHHSLLVALALMLSISWRCWMYCRKAQYHQLIWLQLLDVCMKLNLRYSTQILPDVHEHDWWSCVLWSWVTFIYCRMPQFWFQCCLPSQKMRFYAHSYLCLSWKIF